jgi:hypothetical protein
MPHFGPRKIGHKQFELNKLKEEKTKKFGPRKFGARKAAEMQAAIDKAEAEVTGEPIPHPLEEQDAPTVVTDEMVTTSIKQIREAVANNPDAVDELWNLEQQRPNGPRVGAVKLFLAAELSRDDGPRSDRQAELEAFLTT